MSHSGKYHGNSVLIALVNRKLVTHGSAGLDDRGDSCLMRCFHTVGEGEERIGSQYRTLRRIRSDQLCGMLHGLLCCPDPVYLSGSDSYGLLVFRQRNPVGFHLLYHLPGKHEILHLLIGRLSFGYGRHFITNQLVINALNNQAAIHLL